MDNSNANKKDAATDTFELQPVTALSSFSSLSTETSSSTQSTYATAMERIDNKNKSIATALNTSPENSVPKQYISDDSTSTSTSSSIHVFPALKQEAATSTDKLVSGFSTSTASTITEASASIPIEKGKETAKPNSAEAKDLVLRQPSLRTTFAKDSLSSATSSLIDDFHFVPQSSGIGIKKNEKDESKAIITLDSDNEIGKSQERLEKSKETVVRFSDSATETATAEDHKETRQSAAPLLSSSSQHLKSKSDGHSDDGDDDDDDSMDSTNLQMGHVFVYMVIPPDGGYGWLISFISFLSQIVVDGIIFSIGIILPFIAKDFNTSDSNVVLIASMQIGFYYLSGTVASAFINKYGFSPVAFTGGLLSITVLTISTFSVNLPMMVLFYSILGGPALSMIWVTSQLVIGYYFDRFRPIANGAAASGAGIGIMLFSYMNGVLVPVWGWRNLMRLHVAFLSIVLLMTRAYLEVAPTRIGRVKEVLDEDTESDSIDTFFGLTEYSRYSIKVNEQEFPLDDQFETILEADVIKDKKPATCCNHCLEKFCPFISKYFERQREKKDKKEAIKRYVIKQDIIEKHDLFYSGPKDYATEEQNLEEILQKRLTLSPSQDAETSRWRHTISLEEIDNKYKKQTVINTLSTRRLVADQEPRKYRQTYGELKLTEKRPLLAFLSPQNWLHPKIQKAFSLLFDIRLLAIMEFRILLLSAFLFPMGFNIPFVYSTVRAQIDASFAMLITPTIGFSNFAFRIASGFVAFKFREYTTYICGGGMFFGGFAVVVSAFYGLDVVWFQFLYALCYGIAPAFYSTLRAIIYVHALGLDKLTNAFGLTALAMGLGVFIGTTAGGTLNDLTGSYTASFIFAGICICTAGALKLLLPYFIKLSKDNEGK